MADRANITSIEELEHFRVSLLVYLEKSSLVLDEVSETVKRTRIWLQSEQKLKLDHLIRRKNKEMEMIEAELFSARLSNLQQTKTGHQQQLNRKRREIRDLEDRLRKLQSWGRNFDSRVEVPAKKVDKLRHTNDHSMASALNFLSQSIKSLEAYAELSNPTSSATAAPVALPEPESTDE